MHFNISLLFIVAGSIIHAASASSAIGTNAERMARGLPPMPPARMRRGSASFNGSPRRHPSPSPSHPSSPSPTPSPPRRLPSNCYRGKVQVQYNKGHSKAFLKSGGISLLNSSGEPLEVNVCKAGSHTSFYNIVATNANFPRPHYIGASSGNVSEPLTNDKESSLKFTNVDQTSPSGPPIRVNNGSYVESPIWSLNSWSKELSAKWINPDLSNSTATILFDKNTNEFSFVGGDSQWWNVTGSHSEAVHLYLA